MDAALSRQEYPAMLDKLSPASAVAKLNERVKNIGKINTEIGSWIQERRMIEKTYAQSLKKLANNYLPEVIGELGVFEDPWRKILAGTDALAKAHSNFADKIEKDVEDPLRTYNTKNREMTGMSTIQGNLASIAKELESARDRSDKLEKKGGKANTQKVDTASNKLQSAQAEWDSQAPFVFESLQSLDESRLNHLRNVLTQYETHESDRIERSSKTIEEILPMLIEIDSTTEIKTWSLSTVAGKPTINRSVRQPSIAGSTATSTIAAPQTPSSNHTDNQGDLSQSSQNTLPTRESPHKETGTESKLKSRFGTMLGRRRQSLHGGGFNRAPSPSKGFQPFGRITGSRDGRPSPSPRVSSGNLREGGLASLAESPPSVSPTTQTNGNNIDAFAGGALPQRRSSLPPVNGAASPDLSGVEPPPGPPPSHLKSETQKDSEGFTVPAAMNDPISQAQHEAALDGDQPQFKLDIRKEPIPEQDADAQAALSNVANTLRSAQLPAPNRKSGTVRGRRDVRNTVYMPSPNSLDVATLEHQLPPSPGIATGRAAALATLSSAEIAQPTAAGSDTTSIRSGYSHTNQTTVKHTDMHSPGLNVSIIETMTASFDNGTVKDMTVSGDIALTYNSRGKEAEDSITEMQDTIVRFNNIASLEAIAPNQTFVHPVDGEVAGEYSIDLSHISSKAGTAFTYRAQLGKDLPPPLLVKPNWRQSPDRLDIIVDYSLNPAYAMGPMSFHNLVLTVYYQGGKATKAQTKPTGTHSKDRSLVHWNIKETTLNTNEPHKVVCRLNGTTAACPIPAYVEAKWELGGNNDITLMSGTSLSRLEAPKAKEESDDPFADEAISGPSASSSSRTWIEIETSKKLSGKFEWK